MNLLVSACEPREVGGWGVGRGEVNSEREEGMRRRKGVVGGG
jgi:hypothetical protein